MSDQTTDDPITIRELAQHARRMRRLAGLSQAMAAARSGLPIETIERWENGRSLVKVQAFLALMESYGCMVKIVPPPPQPVQKLRRCY